MGLTAENKKKPVWDRLLNMESNNKFLRTSSFTRLPSPHWSHV
ncbi:hypothetical protein SD77_2223 [Bacillus badius]|uniref:Mobile element protein n=1 Tax=Bacillus badius TaxID=1455 RepID=A0ABR5AYG2_BACBA|nr:hypothetical protein SD77_2223 [Bacillus badius]